jgi:hypothetical protein
MHVKVILEQGARQDRPTPGPSQVMLIITNNLFCIVQRAAAQSKTGIDHGYGVTDVPSIFSSRLAWLYVFFCFLFSFFVCLSCSLGISKSVFVFIRV